MYVQPLDVRESGLKKVDYCLNCKFVVNTAGDSSSLVLREQCQNCKPALVIVAEHENAEMCSVCSFWLWAATAAKLHVSGRSFDAGPGPMVD